MAGASTQAKSVGRNRCGRLARPVRRVSGRGQTAGGRPLIKRTMTTGFGPFSVAANDAVGGDQRSARGSWIFYG